MKRFLTTILSAVMALSVCACGGGAKPEETTTTEETEGAFLTSTTWYALYQGSKLVFNTDNTLTYGENKGTWDLEGDLLSLKYDTQNGTLERDFDVIHEDNTALKAHKTGKADGKTVTYSGTTIFYSEDVIDNVKNSITKKIGESVSTDIIEFTLNKAVLGYSAISPQTSTNGKRTTVNPDTALLPPDGNGGNTFFTSSKGRVLACLDFTIKNTDRNTLNTDKNIYSFSVKQDDNYALVRGYDLNNKDGQYDLTLQWSPIAVNGGEFTTNDTTNKLLDANSSYEIKVVGVVGFEPENLTDPFELVVQLKNSNDETESFLYRVE